MKQPQHSPGIADRVRVHLTGDCDGGTLPHRPEEDGRIGSIIDIDVHESPNHLYVVVFDEGPISSGVIDFGYPVIGLNYDRRHFAAAELEPIRD